MATIKLVEADKWIKCRGCGEQIRTCEKFIQVMENDKPVRGERYCTGCESIAHANNEDVDDYDCEQGLRDREAYAAYQAAGATSSYWTDRDAGYC